MDMESRGLNNCGDGERVESGVSSELVCRLGIKCARTALGECLLLWGMRARQEDRAVDRVVVDAGADRQAGGVVVAFEIGEGDGSGGFVGESGGGDAADGAGGIAGELEFGSSGGEGA